MRNRVHGSKKAKTKPISLYPEQIAFATKRAANFGTGISFSKYFQSLLEYDREFNVLPKAIAVGKAA